MLLKDALKQIFASVASRERPRQFSARNHSRLSVGGQPLEGKGRQCLLAVAVAGVWDSLRCGIYPLVCRGVRGRSNAVRLIKVGCRHGKAGCGARTIRIIGLEHVH